MIYLVFFLSDLFIIIIFSNSFFKVFTLISKNGLSMAAANSWANSKTSILVLFPNITGTKNLGCFVKRYPISLASFIPESLSIKG